MNSDTPLQTLLPRLKALAEDSKGWSNCNHAWLDSSEDEPAAVVGHINEDGEKYPVAVIDCDQYYAAQDSIKLARFYAAANPETVLRLLGSCGAIKNKRQKRQQRTHTTILWGGGSHESQMLYRSYMAIQARSRD